MARKLPLLAIGLTLVLVGSAVTAAVVVQDQETAANEKQELSHLRVVNVAENETAVDVEVDNASIASDLAAGEASAYANLTADSYDVTISSAGNATDGATADLEESISVEAGTANTLVVYGSAGPGGAADLEATVLADDAREPAAGDSAVRVAHYAPDGQDVNVTVTGAMADGGVTDNATDGATPDGATPDGATDGATPDGATTDNATDGATTDDTAQERTVVADSLGFNETSEYVRVPAGEATVEVGSDAAGDVDLVTVNASLEDGGATTIWIVPSEDSDEETNVALQAVQTTDATHSVTLPGAEVSEDGTDTPAAPGDETPEEGDAGEDDGVGDDGEETPEEDDAGEDDGVGDDGEDTPEGETPAAGTPEEETPGEGV